MSSAKLESNDHGVPVTMTSLKHPLITPRQFRRYIEYRGRATVTMLLSVERLIAPHDGPLWSDIIVADSQSLALSPRAIGNELTSTGVLAHPLA